MKSSNKKHSLKQTYGSFTVIGRLTRVGEDGFFNLKPAGQDREKGYACCRMSIRTTADNTVSGVEVSGNEQDSVKYSYKTDDGYKNIVVPWADRYNKAVIAGAVPHGAEVRLSFGKIVGFERKSFVDKVTGLPKEYVEKKSLTGYDAVYEIKTSVESGKLTDEVSLFISGNIKPQSFEIKDKNTGELKHNKSVKLEAERVMLANHPVVFSEMTEEDINQSAIFAMDVVIKEFIELDGVTYLTGIFVDYSSIEEMEFKFATEALAKIFKKKFTPYLEKGIYPMIKCQGQIKREVSEEDVQLDDDEWGTPVIKKRKAPSKQVYVITFGDKASIDTETYTIKNVEEAKNQIKAFKVDYKEGKDLTVEAGNEDWGTAMTTMDDFEEEWD